MKFKILFFASLLRLTQAAPGDEDFCTQFLGEGLNYQDCRAAYDRIPVTVPSDLPSTLALVRSRFFSDEPNTEPRFKLPQTFTYNQCVIEIKMVKDVTWAATTWDFQRKAVKKILDYCVQPHSLGGRVTQRATILEVRKKTNKLKPNPAPAVKECAAIDEGSQLYRCLKDAEDARQAASRALDDFSDGIDGLTYQIAAALDDA